MNVWDILLVALIVLALSGALLIMRSARKKGRGCLGCGGDCSACRGCSAARKEPEK